MAFESFGISLSNEYKKSVQDKDIITKYTPFYTGKELIYIINKQNEGAIISLDIASHAGPFGIYLQELPSKCNLYNTKEVQDAENADNNLSGSLDDIDYSKFNFCCYVELHGCNMGGDEWHEESEDYFPYILSKKLFNAGKILSLVVAHFGPGGAIQTPQVKDEFRHGHRVFYHNGRKVFEIENYIGPINYLNILTNVLLNKKAFNENDIKE